MAGNASESELPVLNAPGGWHGTGGMDARCSLATILPDILKRKRWFGGKARSLTSTHITERLTIPCETGSADLLFVEVEYAQGPAETYALPLAFASEAQAASIEQEHPASLIARVTTTDAGGKPLGVLYDALWQPDFAWALLDAIGQHRTIRSSSGNLVGSTTSAYRGLGLPASRPDPSVLEAQQSNTSVVFGDKAILKLYRRLTAGMNPDWEIGRALTDKDFPYTPPIAGAIEYVPTQGEPVTLAILQAFVDNQGDAWDQSLRSIEQYFEKVLLEHPPMPSWGMTREPLLTLAGRSLPERAVEVIGSSIQSAELLGRRTAELHAALAHGGEDPNFTPEAFSVAYRRARFASMRRLAEQTFAQLNERLATLPDAVRSQAATVLSMQPHILARFHAFLDLETEALRTRCHGDYHLGQLLWTGHDYMIIDFEGEPARSLAERRTKHSPLLDVAGMVRSFHYAPHVALLQRRCASKPEPGHNTVALDRWADFWYQWTTVAFLDSYVAIASRCAFWPPSQGDAAVLLDAHMLEKAVYELGYELNHRPEWVGIPLQGIIQLVENNS